MAGRIDLDKAWTEWLKLQLDRGCADADIIHALNEAGYDGPEIMASPLRMMLMLGESRVDYEGLCNIKITRRGPEEGVQKFDTDLAQIYTVDNFLSEEECATLLPIINASLVPSPTSTPMVDAELYKDYRTSSTSNLSQLKNPIVDALDEKIARFLGINLAYSEGVQAQKYLVGQEFRPHVDWFVKEIKEYPTYMKQAGQRTWTFMIYLNECTKGGSTKFNHFPHEFFPKTGMAVVWNNLYGDGRGNPFTLHCGMPVIEGEKIIITKWFRERCFEPMLYND